MTTPFTPLTEEELQELDEFLLYEVKCDEYMTSDNLDGYLHAIAIGPTSLMPKQWMPGIWGEVDSLMPPVKSVEQLNRILSLIMRHFNSIIASVEQEPREIYPIWWSCEYRGKEYDDAEGWAYGVNGCRFPRKSGGKGSKRVTCKAVFAGARRASANTALGICQVVVAGGQVAEVANWRMSG